MSKLTQPFLWPIIFLLCTVPLHAQKYSIHLKKIGIEEGFKDRNLYYPFQDKDGFVWIGNPFGIDKYDGTRVKHYSAVDHSFLFNKVFHLSQDDQGMLWLNYLSQSEILIFDPVSEKTQSLSSYLGDELKFLTNAVNFVSTGLSGNLLFCTKSGDVYEWSRGKMTLMHHLADGEIPSQVFETKEGSFWINTTKGGINFDENWGVIQRFDKETIEWRNVIEDDQGRLHYISWPSSQLQLKIQDPTFLTKNYINGKLIKWPYNFNQYAVVGIESNTLNKYVILPNGEKEYKLAYISANGEVLVESTLSTSPPTHSFFDRQNNLWLGTKDAFFIVSVIKSDFDLYVNNLKVSPNSYYSARGITEAPNGDLLIHGWGKTYRIDRKSKKREALVAYGLLDNKEQQRELVHGSTFLKDPNGDIWMTNERLKVLKYDRSLQKFTSYNYPDNIAKAAYYDGYPGFNRGILRDSFGKLWIGHDHGLSRVNEQDRTVNQIRNTGDMAALKGAEVFFMHEKPEGVWLATSHGLFLFDNDKIKIIEHYHNKAKGLKHLPNDVIAHIYEDADGIFWLSSKGGGLIKWHPEKGVLDQITEKEGLSNDVIYAAYEDSYDNLWLPSNMGLNQYNKKTQVIIQYSEQKGISHTEFNTASHYRGLDSTLYFGSLNGVTAFNPNELIRSRINEQTPILLSSLEKQSRQDGIYRDASEELLRSEEILMAPKDMGFQIEFSHIDYKPFENKRYAYLIEGIDATWNYLNTPSIRINALDYGQYQLKFRAEQSNGSWTPPISIPITVNRPFYLKTWFFLSCLILFFVAVYVVFMSRLRRSKQREEQLEKEVQMRTAETVEHVKTLEKQTGKLEKQALELQKLDSAKSQFFSNISHELRTPLTLIMGPIDQLISEGRLSEQQLLQLKRMEGSGRNLVRLVEEILELSKLEAGKLEIHEAPVMLKPFLDRLFFAYESMAQRKGIHYENALSIYDQTSCYLDVRKVEKIVNNLLSNALKFTNKGGSVKLSVTIRENQIRMVVDDSGQGIAQKDIHHVFERFYQSQVKDLANLHGGTGIGLALAKELTEAMGGSIGVDSNLGEGSSFEVCIPMKVAPVVVSESESEPGPEKLAAFSDEDDSFIEKALGDSFKLLLVEDNPEMSDYIAQLLTGHYEVIPAGNGNEALEVLKNEKVDLIISDVMMPEMDGFTLLRILKANDLYSAIPVIMLTARAEDSDKLDALTIGVDDYLTKPFLADELKARVKNLLRYHRNRVSVMQETNELIEAGLSEVATDTEVEVGIKWLKKVEKTALATLSDYDFSMDLLAKALGLSTRQMQRRLKQVSGMTPNQYIQELRLQLSRSYLDKLAYHTVAEVANAVGFKSSKYFSKLFKERYGKSPSAYLV